MKTTIETGRLLLRELLSSDDQGMFELDSNPNVHVFLGNKPIKSIDQARSYISNIRQQYITNGIGRWAVILKESGEFVGWAGLKLERNVNGRREFFDLGYRLIEKHWGKGYATEAARAFIDFGFNEMKISKICAYTSARNLSSRKVLEKVGLQLVNTFIYEGEDEVWYEISNPNFELTRP